MATVDHVAGIGEIGEVEGVGIIDHQKDLRLHPQGRVGAGLTEARSQSLAGGDRAGRVDPMHLYRVAGLDTVEGTMPVARIFQFGGGEAVAVVALEAAMLPGSSRYGEARALVLGIGMGVDVAQIHLAGRRGERKDLAVAAGNACDVARRLWPEALTEVRCGRGCSADQQPDQHGAAHDPEIHDVSPFAHGTFLCDGRTRGSRCPCVPVTCGCRIPQSRRLCT